MSGNAVTHSEVIDLTNSDDYIEYELMSSSPGAPVSQNSGDTDDSNVQIVDVQNAPRSSNVRRQVANGVEEVSVEPSQEIAIIEERVLTAQERLDMIREKHARGLRVVVSGTTPHDPSETQLNADREALGDSTTAIRALNDWNALLNQRVLTSIRAGSYSNSRTRNLYDRVLDQTGFRRTFERAPFGNEFVLPFAHDASAFVTAFASESDGARILENVRVYHDRRRPQEERELRTVLERSLTDTHKTYESAKVDIPDPPTTTKEGFVRSAKELKPDEAFVCIYCGHELGQVNHRLPKTAAERSSQVFVRGCGHVYCGECTYSLQASKARKTQCPVKDGPKIPPAKRKKFQQIFI